LYYFDDLSGRVFFLNLKEILRHEILSIGFDDDFDGLPGFGNKFESKTCLSQREAVGDHLTEGKALCSYQFNGPFDIRWTAPIGG
jgi:hypothetical protein